MSNQGRRIIITQAQQSLLPTCNPNLMPFHIEYTGPAAVSMFLRVEKMKAEDEVKEQKEGTVMLREDDEESKVEEATAKEGGGVKAIDEVKIVANVSTVKDENHDSNTNPNVEDEDVKMSSDLLAPADPVQDQNSQLADIEMTSTLPTLPSSSSSLSTIPGSSSNTTLSGSIQSLASTSTLVSSESLNSSILTTPSSSSNVIPHISSSVLKDVDKRLISSFRGRTIHGLTVDLPTGYTGLLLQGDPEPEADHVTRVEANSSAFEGENEVDSGGRKTRSKGKGANGKAKGKAKEKEKEHTKKAPPKGRLARTAAPRPVVEPEVITVDNEDQEMADPTLSSITEPAAEVTNENLELTNDDTNAPDFNATNEIPLRKLIPQSTFSSITLWHADRAVDETRDEYYRTLTEWIALSHEIHRTDL